MWPGYGENSRVLKWVFERVDGRSSAHQTPIGLLPSPDAIDTTSLDIAADDLAALLSVDTAGWSTAVPQIKEHYAKFGDHLPAELSAALDTLERSLTA
jgi:phosphoenolpyruvate carboxykinase (GTP)